MLINASQLGWMIMQIVVPVMDTMDITEQHTYQASAAPISR